VRSWGANAVVSVEASEGNTDTAGDLGDRLQLPVPLSASIEREPCGLDSGVLKVEVWVAACMKGSRRPNHQIGGFDLPGRFRPQYFDGDYE
jgi:hypothetical protein